MVTSPIQTAFNGGEISPRLLGRVDTELYKKALSLDENWQLTPQGSILMRAGTVRVGAEASAPRLIQFRSSSQTEDWIIAITEGHLHIWSRSGLITGLGSELVLNGTFDANINNWTVVAGAPSWAPSPNYALALHYPSDRVRQQIATTPGASHLVKALFRNTWGTGEGVRFRIGTTAGGSEIYDHTFYGAADNFEQAFVVPGATLYLDFERVGGASYATSVVDNVSVKEQGAVIDLVAPWTGPQLADIQFTGEPAADKLYLVHPNVAPQALAFTAPATWALAAAAFTNKPAAWTGTNYPGICEMYQGRLLLGATPSEPHTIWASKSGAPLDFTMGSGAADAYSYVISTKGRLRWAQGQRSLLMGGDFNEHSAVGSNGIITSSDIQVRDESAFGSAPIQGVSIGDQVLFVSRDRRHVRALGFSLQDNGWISRALTFTADHIADAGVTELHFARSPGQTIIAKLADGAVRPCSYDRVEQVSAWWRLTFQGAPVRSAAVAESADGSYLWLAIERSAGEVSIEYLPLHETGAVYVDSSKSGLVASDGTFGGLAHLNGQAVRVIVDGALLPDQVVASNQVAVDAELAGKSITVGLAYQPKAKTLPYEGGSPRGSAQGAKKRFVKVGLILNDSALPLVNGKRVAPDRTPATPQDQVEPRTTGKAKAAQLGWDDGAQITIEQDLPFRTEVLAIFGVAAVNEV